ncbi:MAG TPA: hypothetical protein VHG70_00390 [Nocardioidaceae bacterium]|nr:hypothetical protein [Nocardioidaceae bacterium]
MEDGRAVAGDRALVVVDGANVVGSRPDGWWRDRAGAANRLVAEVAAGLGPTGDVAVVLEGAARAGVPADGAGAVRVVHAAGSGDDEIVDLVGRARADQPHRPVVVVTSDRDLRRRVTDLGAQTQGPGWLWRRLSHR